MVFNHYDDYFTLIPTFFKQQAACLLILFVLFLQGRSLKNLVGLVTGGAGVLGSVLVKQLLAANCRVAVFDLRDPENYGVDLGAPSKRLLLTHGNTASESDVTACLDAIRSQFGRLDFLVNCASKSSAFRFMKPGQRGLPTSLFSEYLENIATGTFNMCRLAAPFIAEKPIRGWKEAGVIINVSSNFAYEGVLSQLSYTAPKAAVRAMTLPMARDLAQHKIRVVCLSPGLFDSASVFGTKKGIAYSYVSSLNLTHMDLLPPQGFADTVEGVLLNPMLNGCNVRVDDGARLIFV